MDYSATLAHRIILLCVGQPNISAMAAAVSENTTRLWYYFHGQRKWPADVWLKVMCASGAASVLDDGSLLIKTPKGGGLLGQLVQSIRDGLPADQGNLKAPGRRYPRQPKVRGQAAAQPSDEIAPPP